MGVDEVLLAAGLGLVGFALFAGGASDNGSLLWLGAGAVASLVVALAWSGVPSRAWIVLPLAGLAAWCAVSIAWSTLPDRSWDYANRTLVYFLLALFGLWLAPRIRALALGLSGLLALVALWALLSKVLPGMSGDYSTNARISSPVGLWNQLALLGDFALPLALWLAVRRRALGALLAYIWIVVLVLTLSRSGIVVAFDRMNEILQIDLGLDCPGNCREVWQHLFSPGCQRQWSQRWRSVCQASQAAHSRARHGGMTD